MITSQVDSGIGTEVCKTSCSEPIHRRHGSRFAAGTTRAAVISDEVVDTFSVTRLQRPELSIFSDGFLDESGRLPYCNLALQVFRKPFNDETQAWSKRNPVLGPQFSEMFEATIRKYQNRAIDPAQVISCLIDLAKPMKDARDRGAMLGLTQEAEAFYDSHVAADVTVLGVLGDTSLREIAKQLVETV